MPAAGRSGGSVRPRRADDDGGIRRVLVPVDMSPPSGEATDYALRLAAKLGSEVTLLLAHEPPAHPPAAEVRLSAAKSDASLRAYLEQRSRSELRRVLDDVASHGVAEISAKLVRGDAATAVLATAREESSDLIVMATRGRTPARRLLLGGVTTKVLAHTPCSIITVKHRQHGGRATDSLPRRILVGFDFGPQSRVAAQWAVALAGPLQGAVTLAHVRRPIRDPHTDTTARLETLAALGRYRDGLRTSTDVAVSCVAAVRDPAAALIDAAAQADADMIVIGGRQIRASEGRQLGAIQSSVIRASSIPVAIVRPDR